MDTVVLIMGNVGCVGNAGSSCRPGSFAAVDGRGESGSAGKGPNKDADGVDGCSGNAGKDDIANVRLICLALE